jgi:hypothetical protein
MEHCHLGLLSILVPAYEQMHMTSDLNSNVTNQSDLGLMLWTVHELSRHERMLAQPWAAARASPAAAHRCRASGYAACPQAARCRPPQSSAC